MKKIINKMPIISAIIIVALFFGISRLVSSVFPEPDNIILYIAYEVVNIIISFLFVALFGNLKVYTDKGMWKTFSAGGYMAIMQTLLLLMMASAAALSAETKWVSPLGALAGIVMLFGIGFREESLFRGIVVNNIAEKYIKSRKGVFAVAIASGVIFGLVHMTNIFVGADLFSATIQSVVAVGAGFYFAAVYLRGGSLWALIIMHTIADAASLFNSTFTINNGSLIDAINDIGLQNLAPFFILTAIGLYLLRREKCDEIVERYNKKPEC